MDMGLQHVRYKLTSRLKMLNILTSMKPSVKSADFLVIGGGVAGLRAAIEVASQGTVIVLTKDKPTESTTGYAQGGIAVALSDEDKVGIHYDDTIKAGAGLCKMLLDLGR